MALQALLPFIPSILGVLGSLFKGNKTKFTEQQSPQQKLAYTQLLQMLMQKNRQGSDPMNQIRQMFYGQGQKPMGASGGEMDTGQKPEYDPMMYGFGAPEQRQPIKPYLSR